MEDHISDIAMEDHISDIIITITTEEEAEECPIPVPHSEQPLISSPIPTSLPPLSTESILCPAAKSTLQPD